MTIGAKLKQWRAYKHLKQDDASSLLGISFSTYQKYEMDISKPGSDAIEAFIKAGINANWLLTGEEMMLRGQSATHELQAHEPVTLDAERLKLAIETIEEVLAERRRSMAPAAKAEAIKLAYQIFEEEDKDKDKASFNNAQKILNRLIKSIT